MIATPVSLAMSRPAETVAASVSAREAARRMHREGIGSLVLVEDERPAGILTRSDLLGLVAAGGDPDATTVGDLQRRAPVTITPGDSVRDAARLMARERISHLPVVENDELVGVCSATDLARVLPTHHIRAIERAGNRHVAGE